MGAAVDGSFATSSNSRMPFWCSNVDRRAKSRSRSFDATSGGRSRSHLGCAFRGQRNAYAEPGLSNRWHAPSIRCDRHRFRPRRPDGGDLRSEEHTSELQSHHDLVCRLLLEKKKKKKINTNTINKKKKTNIIKKFDLNTTYITY